MREQIYTNIFLIVANFGQILTNETLRIHSKSKIFAK